MESDPDSNFVKSRSFKRIEIIGTNEQKVEAYCPIDGTQLVSIREYDFSVYACKVCSINYPHGEKDPASLKTYARERLREMKAELDRKASELQGLEEILKAGNGVL